jgi:hypothetical protein
MKKYRQRGRNSRIVKVYNRKWGELASTLGLMESVIPNMKKMRQRIQSSGPYIMMNTDEGRWRWSVPGVTTE